MLQKKVVQPFALSDEQWAKLEPLLPPLRPVGARGGRPPLALRSVMDAIFFVLRTGCQWKAISHCKFGCSGSSAHRYFQAWQTQGVFERFWAAGLQHYEKCRGIDWEWMSMDGAMTKAPLGGEKNRPQSHGSGQGGHQTQLADRWTWRSDRSGGGRRKSARHENGRSHTCQRSSRMAATQSGASAAPVLG